MHKMWKQHFVSSPVVVDTDWVRGAGVSASRRADEHRPQGSS